MADEHYDTWYPNEEISQLRARIAHLEQDYGHEQAMRLKIEAENQRLRAELAQVDIAVELLVTARKVNQSTVDTAMSIASGCAPIDEARSN